jgi:hypothetical protein
MIYTYVIAKIFTKMCLNVVLSPSYFAKKFCRSVFPSSAAAPGSCIHITAQAELLFQRINFSEAPLPAQWSASTYACPTAAAPGNSSRKRVAYTLTFDGLHASNSSAQHVVIKIQTTQKAAGSSNMELRWSRSISLDFSSGSAAENLNLDLQFAKLYSTSKQSMQPPKKPSEDPGIALEQIKENNDCVSLRAAEDLLSNSKSNVVAAQGLLALLCLVAGIATGRAFSAKLSCHDSSYYIKKQTCEVACSPLIVESGKGARGKEKHKWVRDGDGRLQREDKITQAPQSSLGGAHDRDGAELGRDFLGEEDEEEVYDIDVEE